VHRSLAKLHISEQLARNVVNAWGDDGAQWLAALPAILEEIAAAWNLAIGAPLELSYHYVTAVTCADGTPAVLKLGVPDGGSLAAEAPALALFNAEPENRDPALVTLIPRRIEQLAAELAMPIERVVAWGFVKAMMSDVWSAEDPPPGGAIAPSRALDVARALLSRLR
jgi:hypothetical protein